MAIERLGYFTPPEVQEFLTPGGAADLSATYVTTASFSEAVDDRVAVLLIPGPNVLLTYNDAANTLKIGVTFAATNRILGRITAGAGGSEELTGTQVTSLLDVAGALKGLMSAADKTKLDGIATAATANATDAQLRDRATHTGTQAISTVTGTGLTNAVDDAAAAAAGVAVGAFYRNGSVVMVRVV